MTTTAAPVTTVRPATLNTASAVRIAASSAEQADRRCRLDLPTVAALEQAGFVRHLVPRRWGGTDGTFGALLAAVVEVAESCTSAGWCAGLWSWHGRFAGFLPEHGQRELWGAGPDVRISAAILPPSGRAEPVRGGWQVSGRWAYASGVDFADWILLTAPAPTSAPGGAAGGVRMFAVPRAEVRIVESWDPVGMRGTGSHSVVLPPTRVPARRTVDFARVLDAGTGPDRSRAQAVPAQMAGGLLLSAPVLGAAHRALAAWAGQAADRPLSDQACESFARSSAEVDAAGLLLADAARRADTGPVTEALVARGRRDAAVAAGLLVDAVGRLRGSEAPAAEPGTAAGDLDRAWRDIRTGTGHAALRLGPAANAYAHAVL